MCFFWRWLEPASRASSSTRSSAHGSERPMLDLILGGIVAAGLLIYLVVALLRPEKF
jgi:K+-transporting ATPase KdpF subunit